MGTLVIGTRNHGKLMEFQKILKSDTLDIVSLENFPYYDVQEVGKTFEENAIIKAKAAVEKTGLPALADDSGLEVLALEGKPGIYSARFAGQGATDDVNVQKLLSEMKHIPMDKRQARFVCSLALVFPDGKIFIEHGFLEGYIACEPKGHMGFGYDPILLLPNRKKTVAELLPQEKNLISHRARAINKIKKYVSEYL